MSNDEKKYTIADAVEFDEKSDKADELSGMYSKMAFKSRVQWYLDNKRNDYKGMSDVEAHLAELRKQYYKEYAEAAGVQKLGQLGKRATKVKTAWTAIKNAVCNGVSLTDTSNELRAKTELERATKEARAATTVSEADLLETIKRAVHRAMRMGVSDDKISEAVDIALGRK